MTDMEHGLIWLSGAVCFCTYFVIKLLWKRVDKLERQYRQLISAHNALHGHLRVDHD